MAWERGTFSQMETYVTFTKRNLCPAFLDKKRGGQRALPVLAVSQAPSAQNSLAEVAQMGVACSDPLQS